MLLHLFLLLMFFCLLKRFMDQHVLKVIFCVMHQMIFTEKAAFISNVLQCQPSRIDHTQVNTILSWNVFWSHLSSISLALTKAKQTFVANQASLNVNRHILLNIHLAPLPSGRFFIWSAPPRKTSVSLGIHCLCSVYFVNKAAFVFLCFNWSALETGTTLCVVNFVFLGYPGQLPAQVIQVTQNGLTILY